MKGGIFRRMFALHAVVFALAILLSEIYIAKVVRENHVDGLREGLETEARLVAGIVRFSPEGDLDALSRDFRETTRARVTLITADGKVIGDSDHGSPSMDNHSDRPEVMMANMSGAGWSIRRSDTLRYDLLYVAVKAEGEGGSAGGFVRLAVPLTEVEKAVNLLRLKVVSAVVLVLLATGGLSMWQTGRLKKLTGRVAAFSEAVASGDFGKRVYFEGAGEFEEIARNLNRLSDELKGLIAKNEEEKYGLSTILRSIPDALLIMDAKGTITLTSEASRGLFGGAPLRGRPFSEAVRSPDFFSMVERAREGRAAEVGEVRLDYPEERYLSVRVSPLAYREGELSGFVAIFNDITLMKKLEQVRKDFVANVSHEIKTPVTAIKGFADTLLEGAVDDRENAVRFLRTIKSHSERLDRLVDDLMTISRIELGVVRIEKSHVDVGDVIDSVTAMLGDRAMKKGLAIDRSVKAGLGEVEADRERLVQIFTNLVDNAIKFTERGGVTAGVDEEEGRRFLFVRDTGVGVPKKHLSRLGERFYRVDPSRSRELGGTGLGLAIVKHLVKAHGWEMRIESEEGRGTTVKVYV